MFLSPPILAHGALGWADEIVFAAVIVIFLSMMVVSWFRSRGMDDDLDTPTPEQHKPSQSTEHFELD